MPYYPKIPEKIVVHLGAPSSDAMNVTENFSDYIKNVASSEIYPTWPREALKANIIAQISVALNRVYTEFYRSSGRDFDITSSPAYDQTYVYGRDIFSNISELVDEIFNSYIRREGVLEPLFAEFCDGVEVNCKGLSQWGSVELANEGLGFFDILKMYYGDDIELVTDVAVDNITGSAPLVDLSEGDQGRDVELVQIKLNRISENFPGIPKINRVDAFFDTETTRAVEKFQEIFDLAVDGIVGKATWYRIQFIYNAVKQLYSLNSEGLRIAELDTRFEDTMKVGDRSSGVITVQYYLSYIALFVSTVTSPTVDGVFGEGTREAVISFQKTYGLYESGVVDRVVWDRIERVYQDLLSRMPYQFSPGTILPFPGRVLREGIVGNDVRALQEYLDYISDRYTEIPKIAIDGIYGPSTARAVAEFKRIFDIPGDPERVSAQTWNAITSIYDDLYSGR